MSTRPAAVSASDGRELAEHPDDSGWLAREEGRVSPL